MTSSADPRRPVGAASPRKRVAGARRRPSVDPTTASTLVLPPHAAHERPVGVEAPTSESDEASEHAGTRRRTVGARGSGRLWAPAIGAGLALALLAASLVYALRPSVSDTDRTAAVGSARTTLESLLSYSGAAFDKHIGEVTPQLASPFKDQFTKVAATDIKPMAVKNDATVQAKVYDAGVMDSTGDGGEGTTVRVMAFVNQATTTKAQQAPAIDQNRVIATMRKVGDRWLVSELSAY